MFTLILLAILNVLVILFLSAALFYASPTTVVVLAKHHNAKETDSDDDECEGSGSSVREVEGSPGEVPDSQEERVQGEEKAD